MWPCVLLCHKYCAVTSGPGVVARDYLKVHIPVEILRNNRRTDLNKSELRVPRLPGPVHKAVATVFAKFIPTIFELYGIWPSWI